MPAPVSNTYTVSSGQAIRAGWSYLPAWRSEMAPHTWALVPGNKLSDIDPAANAAINPNYPSAAPWAATSGLPAIVTAWNGACWDDASATFWLPLQGGHSDYAGNEPYKNCLFADTPAWSMLRNPTGATGNTGTLNDGQEASGVYFDGRRRAIHSYNKPVYVPGKGPLVSVQGNTSYTANGPNDTLLLNETTGEMTKVATLAAPGSQSSGGACCYDPTRNRVWWIGSGDGRISYLDCDSWVWTTLSGGTNNGVWADSALVYVPGLDVLCHITSSGIQVFTPAGIKYTPGITGSGGASLTGSGGAQWCSSLGCILFWHNTTGRDVITTLAPPVNPLTTAWTLGTLAVSGSNAVVPTAASGNGTFGRFQVSEKLRAAFLLNATNQQIYAFALD
jgi:hypothetical protein